MARIEKIARDTPGVEHTVGISGQSLILNANAPNLGSMYVLLKPFERAARRRPDAPTPSPRRFEERCRKEVARGRSCIAFGAPPIDGLGTTGGFKLIIEDRGNLGLDELQRVSDRIVAARQRHPRPARACSTAPAPNTPWLYLDIDRTKCMALGVQVSDVFNTLAGLPRLVLRQQLQRVRPDLAGERPGRPELPRPGLRHPAAPGARTTRGR